MGHVGVPRGRKGASRVARKRERNWKMREAFWALAMTLLFVPSAYPAPVYHVSRPAWYSSLGEETDRERSGLTGLVRTVTIWKAGFSPGGKMRVETPRQILRETCYDVHGNMTERTSYGPGGSVSSRHEYVYDPEGRKVRLLIHRADGSLNSTWIYRYDESGALTGWGKYGSDGSLIQTVSHTYHAAGWMTERAVRGPEGGLEWKHVYTYDVAGDLIEDIRYKGDGSLLSRYRYTYHSNGNKTGSEYARYDKGGSIEWRHVFRYDGKGIVIREFEYEADGSLNTESDYTHEFDSAGNWIRQIKWIYLSGSGKRRFTPFVVTYRTVTYYPEETDGEEGDQERRGAPDKGKRHMKQ